MSLLKGFSTYFTGTTFSTNAMLLGSQVILNWKASQLLDSCKSHIHMLAQQNLQDYMIYTAAYIVKALDL